jgi:hypothetical protein
MSRISIERSIKSIFGLGQISEPTAAIFSDQLLQAMGNSRKRPRTRDAGSHENPVGDGIKTQDRPLESSVIPSNSAKSRWRKRKRNATESLLSGTKGKGMSDKTNSISELPWTITGIYRGKFSTKSIFSKDEKYASWVLHYSTIVGTFSLRQTRLSRFSVSIAANVFVPLVLCKGNCRFQTISSTSATNFGYSFSTAMPLWMYMTGQMVY